MAVTLAQAKNYLKLDNDITDDDELVTSLISAAGDYVRRTTGKVNTGDNQSQLYDLCLLICANCKPEDIYRQARIMQSRAINIDNDSHARTKWGCIHQRIRFRTSVGFKRGNRDNH